MRKWRVTIEYDHKRVEKFLSAATYSEAYIIIMTEYPKAVILSISEIR